VVSVLDVLEGALTPYEVVTTALPDVMDLVKAKVRLEQTKSKAQKAARELEAMGRGKPK
jgi:hypothetical protein